MDSNDIRVPVRYLQAADDGDFDEDDGPWRFSGIAVAPGDVLHMEDGTPVLFTAAELEPAADSQAGEPLTADHPTDDFGRPDYPPETDDTYGKVVKAGYIEDKGVGYEATVHDPELARGIHAGTYDVSVHPQFRADETDDETGLLMAQDIEFLDLSVVSKGDSPSNEVNWGPSAELEAWAQDNDISGELTAGANLATRLSALVEDQTTNDDTERSDIVGELAQQAGIDTSTVNAILRGEITCPPRERLDSFAEVLNVESSVLADAARADGCTYEATADSSESWRVKAARKLGFDVGTDAGHVEAQASDEPAESGAGDTDDTATTDTMDDSTITTLVEEHNFSRESLEAMDDDDVERLADSVIDEDGDGDGGQADNQTQASAQIPDDYDSLDEYITAKAEEVSEAKQAEMQKESTVDEIIAHSPEHDQEDRDALLAMDNDQLQKIRSAITPAAQLPGATGSPAELSAGVGPASDGEATDEHREIVAELNNGDAGGDD